MKTLLVYGSKTFKIKVPDGVKITFGPWSPPHGTEKTYIDRDSKALSGTLRIYESTKAGASILAVFSGVNGYRDLSLEYAEEVIVEQGARIWHSDQNGYEREEKVSAKNEWIEPALIEDGKKKKRK